MLARMHFFLLQHGRCVMHTRPTAVGVDARVEAARSARSDVWRSTKTKPRGCSSLSFMLAEACRSAAQPPKALPESATYQSGKLA